VDPETDHDPLIVTQEMCSRMGAVTGKGLSDLIREEFGLRTTFLIMSALVLANVTNVMANFAGVASSLELFQVPKYISVPLGAMAVWLLVVKGNYQSVEKIFLFATTLYVCYIVSGVLVKPDWKEAMISSVRPEIAFETGYIQMLIAMVGTSVAPWMQFYLQAAVVEKGITAKNTPNRGRGYRRLHRDDGDCVLHHRACAGAIWANGPEISRPRGRGPGPSPLRE